MGQDALTRLAHSWGYTSLCNCADWETDLESSPDECVSFIVPVQDIDPPVAAAVTNSVLGVEDKSPWRSFAIIALMHLMNIEVTLKTKKNWRKLGTVI